MSYPRRADRLRSSAAAHQRAKLLKGKRFSVFKVGGALHTGYLRDGVGDLYEDGRWVQVDLLDLPYDANESIGDLGVSSERLRGQSRGRFNPPRWVPDRIRPAEDHEDEITLSPVYTGPSDLGIPEGVIPTSLQLERVAVPGVYRPYSSTFVADDPVPGTDLDLADTGLFRGSTHPGQTSGSKRLLATA